MIEDSEMAFRLEAMKREQEARRQKLQENVNMKMNKLKESANIATEKIRLLNQELQILRLEFQIEETQLDAPREYKQKIDLYKEYCWCCFCPTNSYVKEEEIDVSSVGLKKFFHVKNMDDYEIKLKEVRKRSQQLHSYGWYGCNQVSQSLESCLGVFKFLGILFCPILCLNYFCYHCYAGVKNCCYHYGSRTPKIYRTYSGFQKCGSFASISNKNIKKIEELRKVLAKQKEIRKMMFNQNSNLIEILNNQLECLKLEYENEDLNDKQQYETVESGRSTALCGCITLELNKFEIRQATSQALSSYFKVDDHVDFFQKLDRLNPLIGDQKLAGISAVSTLLITQWVQLKTSYNLATKEHEIALGSGLFLPLKYICLLVSSLIAAARLAAMAATEEDVEPITSIKSIADTIFSARLSDLRTFCLFLFSYQALYVSRKAKYKCSVQFSPFLNIFLHQFIHNISNQQNIQL